jgi:hypothetical protein
MESGSAETDRVRVLRRPGPFDAPEAMVAPAAFPASDAEAVFILGSVRSGTSAVVNSLKDGARLRGWTESNLASLMQQLLDTTEQFFRNLTEDYLADKEHVLIATLDPGAIGTWIRNYFAAAYRLRLGSGRWVEKSPDSYLGAPMVRASPHLAEMFPRARFVFCIRRGIENVLSRQRKFPEVPFAYHCQSWADTIEEWHRVRDALGERAIEVRQRDIALAPAEVAEQLARFLDLSDEQRAGILAVFQGPRVEQTGAAEEQREIDLESTPWDDYQRADFVRFCGPAMLAAGFRVSASEQFGSEPIVLSPRARDVVRLTNVRPENGFTEIDRDTFQLHPNDPGGPPAEVRWPAVQIDGKSRIVADVCLGHQASGPVIFEMRIERPSDGFVCAVGSLEISEPLVWRHCEKPLGGLAGTYDIVLSTRMGPGAATSDFAWARFRAAQVR